jgi:hypothetical protein
MNGEESPHFINKTARTLMRAQTFPKIALNCLAGLRTATHTAPRRRLLARRKL